MGLSVHTGWAACCVVGGTLRDPIVATRSEEIATLLANAGRGLGAPWGKDEKSAALAAWTVMASTGEARATKS
jgi:hypothetical protein